MLLPSTRLLGTPVMSLQTGGQLARTKQAVIDPRNLMILGYELEGQSLDEQPSFLRIDEIRELSNLGVIVDSSDDFIGVNDVIKFKEVYAFHFELIGKFVQDERKHKLGRVIDYSLEPASFLIKQLTVRRPILKSFSDTELLIDRTQIVEVTDTTVTIKNDERQPSPARQATKAFTNPFRGTSAQPETITNRSDQR
jgi:uncharacterized protein YrrD